MKTHKSKLDNPEEDLEKQPTQEKVDVASTVAEPPVIGESPSSDEKCGGAKSEQWCCSNKNTLLAIAIAIVVLIIGAVGGLIGGIIVGVALDGSCDKDSCRDNRNNENTTELPPPNSTTIPPTTTPQTTIPPTTPVLMTPEELYEFLSNYASKSDLDDPASPQRTAYEWMTKELQENFVYSSKNQVLQRYALATLFFATDGGGWDDQGSFLAPVHECNWTNNKGYSYIPTWYGNMRRLSSLGLTCNQYGNITVITRLSFNDIDMYGTIPEELFLLTNLKELLLWDDNLMGTISTNLAKLSKLQVLRLGKGLIGNIPSEIGTLSSLDTLDISENPLVEGTVPTELGQLTHLERLILAENSLTGTIPSELGNIPGIVEIQLSINSLVGTVPKEICDKKIDSYNLRFDCGDPETLVCCCCEQCSRDRWNTNDNPCFLDEWEDPEEWNIPLCEICKDF